MQLFYCPNIVTVELYLSQLLPHMSPSKICAVIAQKKIVSISVKKYNVKFSAGPCSLIVKVEGKEWRASAVWASTAGS